MRDLPADAGIRRIGDTRDLLGEGPVWCEREQALYWVDIRGPFVRRHRPAEGVTESWEMPEPVGSLALRERGGLVVALRSGLRWFDPSSGDLSHVCAPEEHGADLRFNDGKCDPQGRFWVGSMGNGPRVPHGILYRVEPGRGFVPVLRGITIPNSLCWSPDGRTMYFADSWEHTLWAFPFDPETGDLGERRIVLKTEPPGVPDGATVDEDGFIWFAEHDAGRVVRCAPDGRIDRVIPVPARMATAVNFGGPDHRTLFVTSKTVGMDEAALLAEPWAGALLALEPGPRGRPEPRFKG